MYFAGPPAGRRQRVIEQPSSHHEPRRSKRAKVHGFEATKGWGSYRLAFLYSGKSQWRPYQPLAHTLHTATPLNMNGPKVWMDGNVTLGIVSRPTHQRS